MTNDVLYPVKLDVDETALVEAQACAVAVAERRAPWAMVGLRQASHQRGFDAAAVADDQYGGAIRYGGQQPGP
jgi:hypothetical protein